MSKEFCLPIGQVVSIKGKAIIYCGMTNPELGYRTFSIAHPYSELGFSSMVNLYYPINIKVIELYNIQIKIKSVTPTMLILERMD